MNVYVVGNSQRPFIILIDVLLLTSVIVNLFFKCAIIIDIERRYF